MKTNKKKPVNWSKNLTLYEVNLRQYTRSGTFREFETHLPRLKKLGVGILWFMPIQPIGKKNRKGSLGSYYSIHDYTAVSPDYGTIEEFKALVEKIHDMGMYVLLDWVANHTAWDHVWTESHPEFYHKDDAGNFRPPVPEWEDVIDLNFDNQALRAEMINALKFWIEEVDIDGFRCDMAHLVPTSFWEQARRELESVKPLFMLAESENRDLLKSAFDMIYSWNIFHTANSIAKGEKTVHDLDAVLEYEVYKFPEKSYQLLFTSNHDENSWNGSAIERLGYGLETINVLMFTLAGMPLIYTGQEAGVWKRISFFEKDPVEWKADKMTPFYQALNSLRRRNPALWSNSYGGKPQRIFTNNNHDIFAFVRQKDNQKIFVVLNLSGYEQYIHFQGENFAGQYKEIFSGESSQIRSSTQMHLHPWGYRVFEQKN